MVKPNDLVQGKRDLSILKTLSLEPKHGWRLPNALNKPRAKCCKSSKARDTRLGIVCNKDPD